MSGDRRVDVATTCVRPSRSTPQVAHCVQEVLRSRQRHAHSCIRPIIVDNAVLPPSPDRTGIGRGGSGYPRGFGHGPPHVLGAVGLASRRPSRAIGAGTTNLGGNLDSSWRASRPEQESARIPPRNADRPHRRRRGDWLTTRPDSVRVAAAVGEVSPLPDRSPGRSCGWRTDSRPTTFRQRRRAGVQRRAARDQRTLLEDTDVLCGIDNRERRGVVVVRETPARSSSSAPRRCTWSTRATTAAGCLLLHAASRH